MRVFLPEPTLNAASRGGHLTLRLVVLTWHTAHGTRHTAHVLSTDNNRPVVDLGFAKVGSVICKRQTAPQRVWVSGVLCAYTERWPSTVSINPPKSSRAPTSFAPPPHPTNRQGRQIP